MDAEASCESHGGFVSGDGFGDQSTFITYLCAGDRLMTEAKTSF